MDGRILVVDDEPVVLEVLREVLTREGYQVSQAPQATAALELLQREPHELVLCDIRMPGMDGFGLLREIARSHPGTDVLMMTGYASLDGAVEALTLGAADYLIKPLKPKEVLARIRSILERRRLEAEVQILQSELRSRFDPHNIVAQSPRMTAVLSAVRRVAPREDSLVLHGEHGSGRGFLARAVHYSSSRRDQPFLRLACDQGTAASLEEELFGRRVTRRKVVRGLLEDARRGTVLLSNLDSLPLESQQRLAACLRTANYTRVDCTDVLPLDSRVLVTLGTPTEDAFNRGLLHPDLDLLRDMVAIALPPLRERREDIPGLVSHFVSRHTAERGESLRLEPEAVSLLQSSEYPGNVWQLHAILGQATSLAKRGAIDADVVRRAIERTRLESPASRAPIAQHLDDTERQIVQHAVNRHPGRLDQAAKELGISRTTLWRRMRKYDIRLSPH